MMVKKKLIVKIHRSRKEAEKTRKALKRKDKFRLVTINKKLIRDSKGNLKKVFVVIG